MFSRNRRAVNIDAIESWIETRLEPRSEIGKRYRQRRIYVPGEELDATKTAARSFTEMRRMQSSLPQLGERFTALTDPEEALLRLRTGQGDLLDLQRLDQFITEFREIWQILEAGGCGSTSHRPLAESAVEDLYRAGSLIAQLRGQEGMTLAASGAPRLRAAYTALTQAEEIASAAAAARTAELDAAGVSHVSEPEWVLTRAEFARLDPLAVARLVRVVALTAESAVCAILPDAAMLAAAAGIERCARELLDAQDEVLQAHAAAVERVAPAFAAAVAWLAATDAEVQRWLFISGYECTVAEIVADSVIAFEDARFLPLWVKNTRAYTPISLEARQAVVIVGPNMGGKSSALLTGALFAMLVRQGMPVPAKSARIGLFSEIVEIHGGAIDEDGLSAFGREMIALGEILERKTARRFVLLDEFARTTGVIEGMALLLAVAQRLCALGDFVMVATHLDGIAEALSVRQYRIAGLRSTLARGADEPLAAVLGRLSVALDRRLFRDDASASNDSAAFAVAQALGIDTALLDQAHAIYQDVRYRQRNT